jgi:hypothetical protein
MAGHITNSVRFIDHTSLLIKKRKCSFQVSLPIRHLEAGYKQEWKGVTHTRVVSKGVLCTLYLSTIFKTKHILCRTLMKTGLVTDGQQTKQCV